MKKLFLKKCLLAVLIITFFSNCANKETQEDTLNRKKIEYYFYNPRVNPINNEERKIVFNVDLLKTQEMEFLKNTILKDILDKDFNKLAGVSIYYDNAVLNKNVQFSNENILGIIVYEIDNNGLMRNRFYTKISNNNYEEKFSLLESMMSTTNQVFLVYKFFPEIYKNTTIGISTLRDVNLDSEKILKQKNEFDLYRVANTFQNIKIQDSNSVLRSDEEEVFFRGEYCVNCQETWQGICDAGLYCNNDDSGQDEHIDDGDGGSICEAKERRHKAFSSGVLSQTVSESLFDLSLHRRLRDNLMRNYNIGEKYIQYYYAISGFLQRQDYQPETLLKMISTLPEFNNSVEKLIEQTNNGNQIIINESLKNDMFAIIADLKMISNNEDYQFILNDLENDLNLIKNKTKDQILNELH
jgi:hypothetical protein